MPTNDPRPTKSERRDEARLKALAMREEQARKAKRARAIAIAGLAVAVLVLGGVILWIVRQGQANIEAYGEVLYAGGAENTLVPAFDDIDVPSTADETGGIPVSSEGVGTVGEDDVLVTVYLDFMCPYCGQFDAANASELDALAAEGDVTVVYKNISFLDGNSQGTSFSTRAANAAATVADADPDNYTAFLKALFANQPEEGTAGLKDKEIASIALEVGVPQAVVDTFTQTVDGTYEVATSDDEKETREGTWRRFAPFVVAATNEAGQELGKLSTPTVLIDGEKWEGDLYTPGPLTQAVNEAVAAKKG